MKACEMYTTTDGKQIIIDYGDELTILNESNPIIDELCSWIKTKYPLAAIRLSKQYDTQYQEVLRFLKCNFSIKDNIPDIIADTWNLEFVNCPLRGECKDENIICNASLDIGISVREKEVLRLIADGQTSNEIADKLFISFRTVETHRKNIQRKLNLHSIAELSSFAHKNHIV